MGRRLAMAALALAALTAPAEAAEVAVVDVCEPRSRSSCHTLVARFTAAAGERNELSVTYERRRFVFRDRVPLVAGQRCTARADGSVACRAHGVEADLGDGDDVADAITSLSVEIAGGDGADTLSGGRRVTGGPGDDRLAAQFASGDEGADTVTGTAAGDFLAGGDGADTISGLGGNDHLIGDGAEPAPDVLDGGEGLDISSYIQHVEPVHADLPAGTGGGDRLTSIEGVWGGLADDVLIGDGGTNVLSGGPGRNTVIGGAGDDSVGTGVGIADGGPGDDHVRGGSQARIVGGPGADQLSGRGRHEAGPGNDRVFLEGAGSTVACGAGHDEIVWAAEALLPRDCELVGRSRTYPRAGPAGRLTFAVAGHSRLGRGRVELRVRGRERPFAVARFAGGRRTARVRLTVPARIRRLTRRPLAVEVRVSATAGNRGLPLRERWLIDLGA